MEERVMAFYCNYVLSCFEVVSSALMHATWAKVHMQNYKYWMARCL